MLQNKIELGSPKHTPQRFEFTTNESMERPQKLHMRTGNERDFSGSHMRDEIRGNHVHGVRNFLSPQDRQIRIE